MRPFVVPARLPEPESADAFSPASAFCVWTYDKEARCSTRSGTSFPLRRRMSRCARAAAMFTLVTFGILRCLRTLLVVIRVQLVEHIDDHFLIVLMNPLYSCQCVQYRDSDQRTQPVTCPLVAATACAVIVSICLRYSGVIRYRGAANLLACSGNYRGLLNKSS